MVCACVYVSERENHCVNVAGNNLRFVSVEVGRRDIRIFISLDGY